MYLGTPLTPKLIKHFTHCYTTYNKTTYNDSIYNYATYSYSKLLPISDSHQQQTFIYNSIVINIFATQTGNNYFKIQYY